MSAIQEESVEGPIEVIQVLFALHPSFGAQELCGPLEVLANSRHKINDPSGFFFFSVLLYILRAICKGLVCLDLCADLLCFQEAKPSNALSQQFPQA